MVVSRGLAKLHELQTVYGVADLYILTEVIQVDNMNDLLMNPPPEG